MLRWFYPDIRSVKDIVSKYHTERLPRVQAVGFSGLHDMPVVNPAELPERKPPRGMSFQEYAK